jgi:hypothetical protein
MSKSLLKLFDEGELIQNSVVASFATTEKEGHLLYNLSRLL